jgi:IS30 family transposase
MAKGIWLTHSEKSKIRKMFRQLGSGKKVAMVVNRDPSTVRKLLKPKPYKNNYFSVDQYLLSTSTI